MTEAVLTHGGEIFCVPLGSIFKIKARNQLCLKIHINNDAVTESVAEVDKPHPPRCGTHTRAAH